MSVITRFAPSPTGKLHVGNARTALATWLFARHHGGQFILRIDDTDTERSTAENIAAIQKDLQWFGLNWDNATLYHQSQRAALYDVAMQKLKDSGRLYPCYETAEELALKRKSLLARGLPPIYDRSALKLTEADVAKYVAEGRTPHWRFKLLQNPIEWQDMVRGAVHFHGRDMSDPVLVREDGSPLYHICSVVDDIDLGITHILRGEDHVSNTAAHIQMFEALGAKPPVFAHLPLLADAEGGKLSKRLGSLSLEELRDTEGLEPMALASLLARLGTSLPIEAFDDFQPLIESFSTAHIAKGAPKLDAHELWRLNAKLLHHMPFDSVKARLADLGMADVEESLWNEARQNIEKLSDFRDWWAITHQPVAPVIAEHDFCSTAADLLPEAPFDLETWGTWTARVKEATGRKGKDLFMPLRLALTGLEHGPELKILLPILGRDRCVARLHGKAA